ncbi:MAG: Rieske 2Fe-2S domain-containing protein [Epsilonproteobacteria bacterium]|nr:Rieske 2Fe-2S domain-containing protein [Campylobacterota bacterium]
MERRNFIKLLGAGAAVAVSPSMINTTLRADDGTLFEAYEKVKLVDGLGKPIKASSLKKEVSYVFNYPHVGTPCLLIDMGAPTEKNVNLKSEQGESYIWKGGVGANSSIVAYSAICSHQLTHPTKNDSFIKYVPKNEKTMAYQNGGVIVCSSHLSAFDAGAGCKNLSGEAKQPLASIVLEHDSATDELYAVAVLGSDKFQDYFKSFKDELKEFYGGKRKAKKNIKDTTQLVELTEYTKEVIAY